VQGCGNLEGFPIQLQPARLDLAQVQDFIDQFQQMKLVPMDVIHEPLLFLVQRSFQLF
jgi:hypothetical protein